MKTVYFLVVLGAIAVFVFAINQFFVLRKAHSTFENYYAFRGCVELVSQTDADAICKLASGQTIKLVKFQNKWYLDKDLPMCLFGVCW